MTPVQAAAKRAHEKLVAAEQAIYDLRDTLPAFDRLTWKKVDRLARSLVPVFGALENMSPPTRTK